MKPKKNLRNFLLAAGCSLMAVSSAHAADVTWDTDLTSGFAGGAGTWDTTIANWTTDGGDTNVAWDNTTNDTAVFGGTSGGIVDLTTGITVGGLTFNTAGYTLSSSNSSLLTFGASGNINTTADATISSTLLSVTADKTVTKTGAGILTVDGGTNANFLGALTLSEGTVRLKVATSNNTKFFGSINLNGGTLGSFGSADAASFNTTAITVGGDAAVNLQRQSSASNRTVTTALGDLSIGSYTLTTNKGPIATGGSSSINFASTTLTGDPIFNVNGVNTTLGNLSDNGAGRTITKDGANPLTWGTITLSGNHIWNVNAGTLTSGAISTAGFSLTKGGVGTLNVNGALTGGGDVVLNGGTMNFGNALTHTAGTLTLSANSTLGMGTSSTSFSGAVGDWTADDVNLTLTGALGAATTSLRFGTDDTGLSAAQLARTTYSLASGVAKPVTLDADGYVRAAAYDGTWSGGSGNWSSTAIWTNSIIAEGVDATAFTSGGSSKTLTVDSDRTIGNIVISSAQATHVHTIASSGSNTLTLAVSSGTPFIRTSGRFQKTIISANLAGDDGLETGFHTSSDPNGTIVLSGNNTYTGGTKLTYGTVLVGHANALSTDTITFGGGGLGSNGATNYSLANTIALTGNVIIGKGNGNNPGPGTGNLTFSNTAATALGATRTFTVDTGLKGTFAQAFSGATFGITKAGTGTLDLTGASTYTGVTNVSAGALEVTNLADGGSNSSIGASTNVSTNLLLANNTTLRYTGAGDSTDRSFRFNGNLVGLNVTLDASGSGAINFTNTANPTHSSNNQTRTLTLRGDNTGANTLAANLANNGSGALSVTKNDAGTWILTGTNTYTGATTVAAGTLALVGGSQASAITVESGASLGFTLGSSTTSSASVTLNSGHAIAITGTVDNVSDYQLMTATGFTGTPVLSAVITDYELELRAGDTELWLAYTTGGPGPVAPYDTWAAANNLTGPDAEPDAILEADGLTNLQKYAFGLDPNANFTGGSVAFDGTDVTNRGLPFPLLHEVTEDSVDFRAVFGRRKDYVDAGLVYLVQFSAGLDEWATSAAAPTLIADQNDPEIDVVYVPYPLLIQTTQGFEKPRFFRLGVEFAPVE